MPLSKPFKNIRSWFSGSSQARNRLVALVVAFVIVGVGLFVWRSYAATSGYNLAVLADKPVAFWDMKNPGGTEADLTGNGNTGTYKGGTPALVKLLNGEEAVDFNGSSQYMTVPSNPKLSIPTTKQLTWEAWIRPDILQYPNDSSYGYIDVLGKCQDYSPSCEYEARMYSTTNSQNRCNRLSAYVFNPSAGLGSGADWQPTCGLLQAGQWLHVVGEYQTQTTPSGCNSAYPGSIDIWVNGVKWNQAAHSPTGCMSQYNITPKAGNSPLNIGTMALETWFKGAVGKVAIYDYLLSQSQINAHFTAMTGAQPSGSCAATCTTPVPTQTTASTPSDTSPPTVSITSPANNATVSGSQTITANASDTVGMGRVEFYDGTTLLGTSTAAPFAYSWNSATVANGNHTLTAKAYDAAGNAATSQPITVTVSNQVSDTSAPTIPAGLTTTGQTDNSISLSWNASSDNVGVAGYKVYRYGSSTSSATVSSTRLTDTGLAAGTSYNYTVSAFDAAGNESPQSAVITATTKAAPTAPTSGLSVSFTKTSTWSSGYCSTVTIKNTGNTPTKNWQVTFPITGRITSLWNAKWSQAGSTVTASNLSWNGIIKAGQAYSGVGFCASTP